MSLKTFHVFFISASILLCFGFGVWGMGMFAAEGNTVQLVMGLLSVLSGVFLIWYGIRFLKKLRHVSYL